MKNKCFKGYGIVNKFVQSPGPSGKYYKDKKEAKKVLSSFNRLAKDVNYPKWRLKKFFNKC